MNKGRKSAKVLTARILCREKSYGTYLYMTLSREVERKMGWQKGDIVQLLLNEKDDLIVLHRIFRTDEAAQIIEK